MWGTIHPDLSRPIFIVGAPRSGTTFLGECIRCLPTVSYHFEPVAVKYCTPLVYTGVLQGREARWTYRWVYGLLKRLYWDGDLRFAEKTPENSFILPFLLQTFPDAQFVHILRDGRDAAYSLSQKPWLKASSAGLRLGSQLIGPHSRFWVEPERRVEFETTGDFHRCIWSWRRHVEDALAFAPRIPAGQYYEMRYESFVRDPIQEGRRLLAFLGISDAISREQFERAALKASPNSVGRWRENLTPEDLGVIEVEAGHLLDSLGYVEGAA